MLKHTNEIRRDKMHSTVPEHIAYTHYHTFGFYSFLSLLRYYYSSICRANFSPVWYSFCLLLLLLSLQQLSSVWVAAPLCCLWNIHNIYIANIVENVYKNFLQTRFQPKRENLWTHYGLTMSNVVVFHR